MDRTTYHVGYEATRAYQEELRALAADERQARQARQARRARAGYRPVLPGSLVALWRRLIARRRASWADPPPPAGESPGLPRPPSSGVT